MFKDMLRLIRAEQWYKNLIIFTALFFSFKFLDFSSVFHTFLGFTAFCLISSAMYIINDLNDIEEDKKHKEKKNRPLASGKISVFTAIAVFLILIILTAILSFSISEYFIVFPLLLFLNTLLYTLYFKKITIIDIESISVNYVLRAVSGAMIINVRISLWFVIFVFILALFLVSGKRKSDLSALDTKKKVYETYNEKFLEYLIIILGCSIILFYSLYTFMAHPDSYLFLTIPIVIFLTLRFLFFVSVNDIKSRRAELLFKDLQFFIGLVIWVIATAISLYLSQ